MKRTRWRALAVAGAMTAALAACASPSAPSAHLVSLQADGRSAATLQVLTGTSVLKIGMANLGASGELVRVGTPAGSPPPQLRVGAAGTARPGANGVVYLSAKGAAAVTITLNASVSWELVLAGGSTRTIADLRGGRVTGIAFTAGSDVIDLTLPRPQRDVPIGLAAGASQLLLRLPTGVQARVTASAGAGDVSVDGTDHTGVAAGSVFTTPSWAPGTAGFDLEAVAGAAHIAVTTSAN